MNIEQTIKELGVQCEKNLKAIYEGCCEEYRRRLCALWEVDFEESWWVSDHIGDELRIADWWLSLSMEQIRYLVDNAVAEEKWLEYCDYLEREFMGHDKPRINFWSWFKLGLRPCMLEKEG